MGISAKEFSKKLKKLANLNELQKIAEIEIRKNEKALVGYKIAEYLDGNIYGEGEFGNPSDSAKAYYSLFSMVEKGGTETYAEYKHKLNPFAGEGVVDLILTGAFVESMYLLKPNNGKYLFDARDSKKSDIVDRYGNVFGLTQDAFNDFIYEYVANGFRNELKTRLNG